MKNDTRVILFCSGHFFSLGLVRTLGRAGYRPECFAYGYKTDTLSRSRYISKYRNFPTAEEVVAFLRDSYPTYEDKPILITSGDVSQNLVDLNFDALNKKFVLFSAGEQGKVGWWMDKQHISDLARKHGLDVPPMIRLHRGDPIPENIDYPVFTKPIRTVDGGKKDEYICHTRGELVKAGNEMLADEYLVEPYLDKVKELSYFGIAVKDKVYINYIGEDVRPPEGAYGGYTLLYPCRQDSVYDSLISMIRETGYEGIFGVDMLLDRQGTLYFLEVNFRADGATYLLSYGINLPDWWCRLAKLPRESLPDHLETSGKTYYGITEKDDFKYSVQSGKVSLPLWLWQYLRAKRHSGFYLWDLRPHLHDARRSLQRRIRSFVKYSIKPHLKAFGNIV